MTEQQKITAFFEAFFRTRDLRTELNKMMFDGFESYSDYVKYGDMFCRSTRFTYAEITPPSHQLKA